MCPASGEARQALLPTTGIDFSLTRCNLHFLVVTRLKFEYTPTLSSYRHSPPQDQ